MPDADRLAVLSPVPSSSFGWALGSVQHNGVSVELLGFEHPLISLEALPEGPSMTIAFSGAAAEDVLPWGAAAWEAVEAAVGRLNPDSGQLLLRGHHGHVLADAPACLGWLDHCQKSDLACGVALAPASMLAASMLELKEEHLVRMFEYLGRRCGAVIIEDLVQDDDGEHGAALVGEGILPGSLIGELLDRHVPAETPIFVLASGVEVATRWLWQD